MGPDPPKHLRHTARTLGLHHWVFDRGDFPLEAYCETVDDARAIVRRHQSEDENVDATWAQLVPAVAQALDTEGALCDHALEFAYPIDDESAWWKVCCAAAWVVLERYHTAVENREWPPQ